MGKKISSKFTANCNVLLLSNNSDMTMTMIMKHIYLIPTLYIQWRLNIACKEPNTVKPICMQFFRTIMEI